MAENTLRDKTVNGVGWSFVDTIAGSGVTFVVSLLLARILSPAEYGLIGIVTIFITVLGAFVDSGFSTALIRMKDADDVDYSTGFFTNLAVSIVLFLLLFLLSPFIAVFFKESQLTMLIRAMSCIIIIRAFAIVQGAILTKRVDFKTQTKASIISSISSGVAGISTALMGMGVWALVFQQITRQLLYTFFLWYYNRWKPLLVFSRESFMSMWSFGWKIMMTNLISTFWNELNQIVIGKCYSPSSLGLYTRAYQFSSLCSVALTGIVQRVSFPVLSNIQDENERMRAGYQRIIKTTVLLTFLLMIGMASCAKSLIYFFVGEKWFDCVPMLQLLCLAMMLYPLHAINLNILQVKGRSDIFLKLEIVKKFISIIPLLLGIFVGIYWMLIAGVITSLISYFLNAYYSGPFVNYKLFNQIKDIMPSLRVAIMMGAITYIVGLLPISMYILFPLQVSAGIISSIGICEFLRLSEYQELKEIISTYYHKLVAKI